MRNTAPTSRTCATRSRCRRDGAFRGSSLQASSRHAGEGRARGLGAIPAPGGGSRAFCDRMNAWAQGEGQPGLGYIFWRRRASKAGRGPDRQEHRPERTERDPRSSGLKAGDAVFFAAGKPKAAFVKLAGQGAHRIGEELNSSTRTASTSAGSSTFPMYEWNEEEKKIDFSHNPFSMPQGGLEALRRGSARHPGLSSTTSSATASSCRRAPSATTSRRS
jgi:aspartyl-tRNA synthetase